MLPTGRTSRRYYVRSPVGKCKDSPYLERSEKLIGISSLFRTAIAAAEAVASNDCITLIEGESGTGKELLARYIHSRSARRNGPFIPINCAGISETLFESQFFGHLRGAFTGAVSDTLGVVRAAQGGTLLLDEVSEIPLHQQAKLLRVLQEREVIPVGGATPIPVDVRFIATTNTNLRKAVEEGRFRLDLYHRINIARIELAPLRFRKEDIDPLLDYYLEYYADEYSMPKRTIDQTIREQLRQYDWPGNVRELCNYVERLYATDLPPLPPSTMSSWQDDHRPPDRIADKNPDPTGTQTLSGSLAEVECRAIVQALNRTGWNRSAAARLLEIHRTTLLRKMRLYGLIDRK